jgi:hypothetical protein
MIVTQGPAKKQKAVVRRPPQWRARLQIECLEDRCLPSAVSPADLPAILHYTPTVNAGDTSGRIWFAGGRSNVVGFVDPDFHVTEFVGPVANPASIAVGTNSLWLVAGQARNTIARIEVSGLVSTFAIPSGNAIARIAIGPDANLWFVEPGGAGWIDRSTGTVVEYRHFTLDSPQFSLGPDGSLLLIQGRNTLKLTRTEFLGLVSGFGGGGGGGVGGGTPEFPNGVYLSPDSVVDISSYISQDLAAALSMAFPSGLGIGPIFIGNWPMTTFVVTENQPGHDGSGRPPPATPGPSNLTEQIVWMSLADHGAPGARQSPHKTGGSWDTVHPRDDMSSLPVNTSKTLAGSFRISGSSMRSAPTRLAGARAESGPDITAVKDLAAMLPGALETLAAVMLKSSTFVLNVSLKGTVTFHQEEAAHLARHVGAAVPSLVSGNLAAASGYAVRLIETLVAGKGARLLSPADHDEQSALLDALPDKNSLLAIAREYRHDSKPVSSEAEAPSSRSKRFFVRVAAAWLIAQSAHLGIGRKSRRMETRNYQ